MRRMVGVAIVLLLALVAVTAPASGQTGGTSRDRGFQLEQNYPNPFNPETRIPFRLDQVLFQEGKPVVVSLTIYNTLLQPVAVPTALEHPAGAVKIEQLVYPAPGRYEAYWDGKDKDGNKVASGIYLYQLVVNGRRTMHKMVVAN